jgi:type I restriction enzyme S subunit
LTKENLIRVPIPVPSQSEQAAIADALTQIDHLMTAMERSISKKQAIRQGMIQQLLTGRTRLPGFSKPWSRTSLGALGTFLKGRGVKRDDVRTAGVPCIRYGELYTAFNDYTPEARSFVTPDIAATALPLLTGDLLFAGSGETREEIGKCIAYIGDTPAVAGGDLIVLRGSGFNSVYVALLTNTPAVANQKARAAQGDAVVHISSYALGAVRIDLPQQDEQNAIASVILNADRELSSLYQRLTKAQAMKRGMMQQLLTGRIRLPI